MSECARKGKGKDKHIDTGKGKDKVIDWKIKIPYIWLRHTKQVAITGFEPDT